jgi:hypothetical protein
MRHGFAALIAERAPAWFDIKEWDEESLCGRARPPRTGWLDAGLDLRISVVGQSAEVAELSPGTHLPAYCPERHIQPDSTFCLGLEPRRVRSRRQADRWWTELQTFLVCQSIAADTLLWPPQYALDHGDAGRYHRLALRLAKDLGIEQAYLDAYFDAPSWLTGEGVRKFGLKAGRSHLPARPRRPPAIKHPKRNRLRLMDLVAAEQKRRRALAEFWAVAANAGIPCCQSMRDCPLTDAGASCGARRLEAARKLL